MNREQIESLGWLHDDCEPNNYVKGGLDLFHDPKTGYVKIDDADGDPVFFDGVVESKTQLAEIESNITK